MIQFIEVLRAIATALIANSHFKGVYPTDLLSFGGGFGLALFYMISGFLLANIKPSTKFTEWYFKKVARLYIPLVILKTIEIIVGYLKVDTVGQFVREFIFPASWFGASMLILYLLYYGIVKKLYIKNGIGVIRLIHIIDLAVFLLLFITKNGIGMFSLETLTIADEFSVETPYIISLPIWMSSMLAGFEVRKIYDVPNKQNNSKNVCLYGIGVVVNMVAFFAVKILEKKAGGTTLMTALPVIYIGFAYTTFRFFMVWEEKIEAFPDNIWKKAVWTISACSLEIYYIQFPWIHIFRNFMFPINWVLIVTITVLSAYLLHCISNIAFHALVKRKVGK